MNKNGFPSRYTTSLLPAPAVALVLAIAFLAGCASPPLPEPPPLLPRGASSKAVRSAVVDTARRMLGARYHYGGSTPEDGFDCSGLVVYSYRRAGVRGLPRSARELERRATPISLEALQPGDLIFFRPGGAKTTHVAIYEGKRRFIHAPSSGKRVERVAFDHVYWGPRIRRAGRLLP
jgi:cell wall-associated NlpC family hydrolase